MRATAGNQKRSNGRPVVVGVADHNGWAILVSAAVVNGEPTVVDRRRVRLIEKGVPSQPYHHETLALSDAEAEQLLRKVKRSIAACTALAFDRLSADLSPRYRVSVHHHSTTAACTPASDGRRGSPFLSRVVSGRWHALSLSDLHGRSSA